ncbi:MULTISPECIES: hypothetical protein [Spongiibacter]|uniref:hypothetical protein n=1 Tax=Spongiibacter TaxID=630749 RepID=UPI000C3A809A|nr:MULTISPECIES: hypothetical protein [Spongiibacter]MAY40001.1 hypothetical protein [Spongiibacter sp.]|tara:strand:+ start:199 stop:645 length:447 start_codon:yes stop_codon:yes gene_type:complete
MIEILKKFSFLAPYATALGVVVAMVQLWRTATQSVTTFEDSISKEYREITRRIPYKALVGIEMSDVEKEEALNEIYNYMDLCNEQIFLRKAKRVRKTTWNDWQEGMKLNFGLPFFREASEEILDRLPTTFNELRKVQDSGYKTDPGKW